MNKTIHLNYIADCGPFTIDCNRIIFSTEEIEILETYGHWFAALEDGTLTPLTDLQRNFVDVCRGVKKPMSTYEVAWFKYVGRKKIEREKGNSLYQTPQLQQDTFYSREHVKQLRKTVSRTVWENHRKAL